MPHHILFHSSELGAFMKTSLTDCLQTSAYPLRHPPHTRDYCASRRICALLQELPIVHPHTSLRYTTCHLPRPNTAARFVCLHASRLIHHPPQRSLRISILLSIISRWQQPQYPSPTSDPRRNCWVLLSDPSTEVLSASPTAAFPLLTPA
jgi:hypothetical protein